MPLSEPQRPPLFVRQALREAKWPSELDPLPSVAQGFRGSFKGSIRASIGFLSGYKGSIWVVILI